LPDDTSELETRVFVRTLHAWHALESGNFGAVADCYGHLLDLLEESDSLQVWYHGFQRPLYVQLPGMCGPLIRFVEGVTRRIGDQPTQIRAIVNVIAAWLALWRGDL